MKKKIIQAITLTSFFGLIIGFVTYRSGLMDNNLQSSPNGGNINLNANALAEPDSIIVYDTIYPTIMSSSKSFVAANPKPTITTRKIANPKRRTVNDSSTIIQFNPLEGLKPEQIFIMTSSKSGAIFPPNITPTEKTVNNVNVGANADSIKAKQAAPIQIMGSSKSDRMFVPVPDTTKKR